MSNTIFPPVYVGDVDVSSGELKIGDLTLTDVGSGYKTAGVYVERLGAEFVEGLPVARIHIEIFGDEWAQAALDAENEEAARHPLGPEAYWREKGLEDLFDD